MGEQKMNSENRNSRCCGQTKAGEPCRAAATAGGLCYFHANPAKARELGRIGGRMNHRPVVENSVTRYSSDAPADPLDRLEHLYRGVESGQIAPDKSKAMLAITVQLLRYKQYHDLVERMARIEKLAQQQSQSNFEKERRGTETPGADSEEEPME